MIREGGFPDKSLFQAYGICLPHWNLAVYEKPFSCRHFLNARIEKVTVRSLESNFCRDVEIKSTDGFKLTLTLPTIVHIWGCVKCEYSSCLHRRLVKY